MRTALPALLLALLILALGWLGWERWFGARAAADLRVLEVLGEVELTRAGQTRSVEAGQELLAQDGLHVGEGGRAVVGIGAETRLDLEEQSSIRVLDVSAGGVRVELEEGRVSARVRPGSPALGVVSGGRTVSSAEGSFTVAADRAGVLAVQTAEGEARLEGVAGATAVPAGSRLVDVPGQTPSLGAIPAELLLEVSWPSGGPLREDSVVLKGKTNSFANVRVVGAAADVDARAGPDGRFELSVPLAEGENAVRVQATDVLGEEAEQSGQVSRDSTAPKATKAQVLWDR